MLSSPPSLDQVQGIFGRGLAIIWTRSHFTRWTQADEVKKGIGKGGVNIKLAGMLVDREIEVWREIQQNEDEEDDVLLSEFSDVIDPWVIERLQSIGCDTARSVMALDPAEIATRADLEDETVEDVLKILHAEFEE